MTRRDVLTAVARLLVERVVDHPLRVGIDGVCGVGKSIFATELVGYVRALGRPAVRVDSDGFHHVRARRHRNTTDPARGYYDDAYDFAAVREHLLLPLGRPGPARYAATVHDLATDVVATTWAQVPADAVVLFDATFLQRGELRALWDEVIWLAAPVGVATDRGVARDAGALGGEAAARRAYETRYLAACRLYLAEQDPERRASIVVEHGDPARPRLRSPRPATDPSPR